MIPLSLSLAHSVSVFLCVKIAWISEILGKNVTGNHRNESGGEVPR